MNEPSKEVIADAIKNFPRVPINSFGNEIKELQKQLAEVKRQKEALQEKMQIEATLKAVNEIKMEFYKSKIRVFYNYLNDIQNSKVTIDQTNLIYYLFSVLDVDVVLN